MKSDPRRLSILSFHYDLPEERIAKKPTAVRDQSKLLVYRKGEILDTFFGSLDQFLVPGDLLVFNETKVINARILFQKESGSTIEIMCLEPYDVEETVMAFQQKKECRWNAMVGNAKRWKEPLLKKQVSYKDGEFEFCAEQVEKSNGKFVIRFSWNNDLTFSEVIDIVGKLPLPPYLNREADEDDQDRYQTVYAQARGSVAAPTAGLHFTPSILKNLEQKNIRHAFVTLHVGAGTFKPVKSDTMEDHEMHEEKVVVPLETLEVVYSALQNKQRIIAVGTTSLRTIESLYWFGKQLMSNPSGELKPIGQWEPYDSVQSEMLPELLLEKLIGNLKMSHKNILLSSTQILIAPGYEFKIVKGLITNFHQPESTLLLLVSAFIGDDWKKVYDYALKNNYRFLSYGDSSLLLRE